MKRWIQSQEWAIRTCFMLMFLFGIVMSVMVPPWQVPDEETHVVLMGQGICNSALEDVLFQDMELDCYRIKSQPNEKVNVEQWKAAMTRKPGYDWKDCMPKGIRLSAVKHLPALAGMMLGILMHLPTFWVLELAEVFSLAFYVVVCWCAVKLMPVKKELLMLIMVFPMSLQQASSVSYDATLLPLCFLFLSYVICMRCQKEQLHWKEAVLTILLLLVITYIKLPYALLGLLVFLLPKEKIQLQLGKYEINGDVIRRFRIPAGILLILVCGAVLYVVRSNFWVQLMWGMILEWKRSVLLFLTTAEIFHSFLMVSSVGQFGWLESQLPLWFVRFTYLLMIVMAVWGRDRRIPNELKGRAKLFLWIVFAMLSGMIALSMVNHMIMVTLYGTEATTASYNLREALYEIPYIGGIQGRYFIPFLALPFLGLPQKGREVEWKIWIPSIYLVIAKTVTIRVLYFLYCG